MVRANGKYVNTPLYRRAGLSNILDKARTMLREVCYPPYKGQGKGIPMSQFKTDVHQGILNLLINLPP